MGGRKTGVNGPTVCDAAKKVSTPIGGAWGTKCKEMGNDGKRKRISRKRKKKKKKS